MTTPEAEARIKIDELLTQAGWLVQDRAKMNLGAGIGVAVREFALTSGFADYLLFVNRKAIGVIEAKAVGTTLSGVVHQSKKYSEGIKGKVKAWHDPLPFLYQSTGVETFFTGELDPDPRSRRVFAFHQPATLADWAGSLPTLRAKLQHMPPLITTNLWDAQIEAITNLEKSFAEDKPRALIQMATGSGKTFTAVNFVYRLIKHGGAKRVLFLVDRSNLGRQTHKEFQQFTTPDDGRKFTELYNVQHLASNNIDKVSRVCITTIQRLYSMLAGEELDPELEEISFDMNNPTTQPKPISYNPTRPIEEFDFIVTDECHRSIYNLWRQVLEYYDAHLVGLTATPSKQTMGFFNQNLVMEYTRERAVADGVNVDGQVYKIRTQITGQGSKVEAGYFLDKRDRRSRKRMWEELDDELVYEGSDLDREVVSEDQIRTIIRAFKDRLFTDLFPGRTQVPKTLIFAKDDSHAEDIVGIVREEFGKGDEFCQKITYKTSGKKPEELISELRTSFYPRIAVTVDMIATGTDIKPLEILLFMRMVRSKNLFEQMIGRGTRVINSTDLQAVTPDTNEKTHFVLVDAVGVVDTLKVDTQSLERKKSVPFDKLLEQIAVGTYDEDSLLSLAGRLSRLEKKLTEADRTALQALGVESAKALANRLLDATDPERQEQTAAEKFGNDYTPAQFEQVKTEMMEEVAQLFDDPNLREKLQEVQNRSYQIIDTISIDKLVEAGFSQEATEKARQTVESFRQFLEEHKDEITALQILYNQPYSQRRLDFRQIKELSERLKQQSWTPENLWQSFAQVEEHKVKGVNAKRVLTDLVSLVRHALKAEEELIPFPERVQERYEKWLAAQEAKGRSFTPAQRWWLDRIAGSIGVNLSLVPKDLDSGEFQSKGGRMGAFKALGENWQELLEELNTELAA